MVTGSGGRRAAQRAELLTAVRVEAYRQIAAGGLAAVSMSAIAQAIGVSGAALYRYFPSRDELVRMLLTESFQANADVVTDSLAATSGNAAPARLRHLLSALHAWAVTHPIQYAVVSGGLPGADQHTETRQNTTVDPDDLVDKAARPFYAICRLVAQLPSTVGAPTRRALAAQAVPELAVPTRLAEFSAADIAFAMIIYSRLHGANDLQIADAWRRSGLDADTMFHLELELLLADDGTSPP
jgi:AcrR family transcriptional regulator